MPEVDAFVVYIFFNQKNNVVLQSINAILDKTCMFKVVSLLLILRMDYVWLVVTVDISLSFIDLCNPFGVILPDGIIIMWMHMRKPGLLVTFEKMRL